MTRADIDRYEAERVITARQAEVLRFRLAGFSHREIGFGLGKAPETIRGHQAAALRRIATHRRAQEAA